MNFLIWCVIGYFFGSVPSGFLLTKYKNGIDLRAFGSKSIGATNVLRTGNKKLAALTLLCDLSKGLAFTLLISAVEAGSVIFYAAFCCLLGHVYPIWLKFKGGKGVATVAGIFFALSPAVALCSAVIWGACAKLFKVSSIASLSFSFSFASITLFKFLFGRGSFDIFIFAAVVFAFLLYTHKENLKKLLNHGEYKFNKNFS